MLKKISVMLIVFIYLTKPVLPQAIGSVTGRVVDGNSGESIIGANVFLEGTNLGGATDLDGRYVIKNVPLGKYNIIFSFISYSRKIIADVSVTSSEPIVLNASLFPEAIHVGEILVTDKRDNSYESALLNQQKKSSNIMDGISAEQIKKNTDNTTAEVLRRAPGITLVDNKYIYIRGVSERYNGALLNNSPLASAEPEKRDFAFDLIPANLIENTQIYKSFTADEPGDFSGGLVKINTVEFPSRTIFTFSYSSSYVNDVSTKSFKTYEGGSTDFLGIDDGSRELPSNFPDPTTYKNLDNNRYDTTKFYYSTLLNDNWGIQNSKAFLDQSFNITYGDRFSLFNNEFGLISAITYKTGFTSKQIITRDEENEENGTFFFDYSGNRSSKNVYWGAILNLTYKLGEHHKIGIKNNFTVNADDEVTELRGFKYDYQDERIITALRFLSRNLYSGQISGTSYFPWLGGVSIDWRTSYSSAFRNEPDYRRNAYTRSISDAGTDIPFIAYIPRDPDFYSGGRFYSKSKDYVRGYAANFSNSFGDVKIKLGITHQNSSRSFNARLISVTDPYDQAETVIGNYALDSLYSKENFAKRLLVMREYFDPSNNYSSSDNLFAYFARVDLPFKLFNQNFSFISGLRVENYILRLRTISSIATGMKPVIIDRFSSDLLPALSLIYYVNEIFDIRLSFSRTVNRPQFREIAPFLYYNFEDQTLVRGNIELKQANIANYDFRVEAFPDLGELISVSIFLKELRNPIERVFVISTGQNDRTFQNSSFARNSGIEIEYRTSLAKISNLLDNFSLSANYSRIWSEIEETNVGVGRKIRPMQGQSPYVINLALSYKNILLDFSANISYNKFGRRIIETANFSGDDLFESPKDLVDIVLTKGLSDQFEIKFTIKDLLAQPIEYFEENRLMRKYSTNTKLSLGVSYKL
ncbi:MAG: carboxypeptidase-like regulatory domain-containing protein [Ignavibacteriaceae bacterium]|nr:carboxypeptidase-like regulatory domain-containing protein [Ignavibacteriaceae bacterium]